MTTKLTVSIGATIAMLMAGSALAEEQAATQASATSAPAAQAAAAPAASSEMPADSAVTASAGAQVDVSDDKLQEFAKVHKEVTEISSSYQGQLQATEDPEKVAEISQQANKEMVEVVEKSPISVEEYNQIAMLLQQDQKLQQKYRQFSE